MGAQSLRKKKKNISYKNPEFHYFIHKYEAFFLGGGEAQQILFLISHVSIGKTSAKPNISGLSLILIHSL
jgi:hypothetical protein